MPIAPQLRPECLPTTVAKIVQLLSFYYHSILLDELNQLLSLHYLFKLSRALLINRATSEIVLEKIQEQSFEPRAAGSGSKYGHHCAILIILFNSFIFCSWTQQRFFFPASGANFFPIGHSINHRLGYAASPSQQQSCRQPAACFSQ